MGRGVPCFSLGVVIFGFGRCEDRRELIPSREMVLCELGFFTSWNSLRVRPSQIMYPRS